MSKNMSNQSAECGNWLLWCRLCAKEDPTGNTNVFIKEEQEINEYNSTVADTSIVVMPKGLAAAVEKYFWVNITSLDELPKVLCAECLQLITSLQDFAERVAKVQKMFYRLQEEKVGSACLDLLTIRKKYGVSDENWEHMQRQKQTITEVFYLETKPQLNEMEDNITNVGKVVIREDPLEQDNQINTTKDIQTECAVLNKDVEKCESSEDDNICDKNSSNNDEEKSFQESVKRTASKETKLIRQKCKRKNNAELTISCSECPKVFRQFQTYRSHMKNSHMKFIPLPQITCPQCTSVFTHQALLERHLRTHLPNELRKTCPCPYCDKKFRWNYLATQHIKQVHMNERPFVCDECGLAVHTSGNLKAHMVSHSNYAAFVCEVCQKRFKDRHGLNLHMETHNDNKYICSECGKQLNSRVTLRRHLLVHSDVMQHKCDYCGRAFKRAKALKAHLLLHTGLKPYTCDFCERTFASGANFRSHTKKSHPKELAEREAAGGPKPCARNIPDLKTLKAITKNAENLTPVASKESGCFAYGKKTKRISELKQTSSTSIKSERCSVIALTSDFTTNATISKE